MSRNPYYRFVRTQEPFAFADCGSQISNFANLSPAPAFGSVFTTPNHPGPPPFTPSSHFGVGFAPAQSFCPTPNSLSETVALYYNLTGDLCMIHSVQGEIII